MSTPEHLHLAVVSQLDGDLLDARALCSAKKKIGQKQRNIAGLERVINAGSIFFAEHR